MAVTILQIGTPSVVNAAIAALTAPPGNSSEAALLSRLISVMQTEVNNMGAANAVQISGSLAHTEKTCDVSFQIDKATPVLGVQLVQLSNASPAN